MVLHGISRRMAAALIVTFAMFASASWATPGYFVIHNRAHFASLPGTHVLVDWSSFGGPGDLVSTPYSVPFPTGAGPEVVTVSSSQGVLAIHQEGTDYLGDFTPGDFLLTDASSESDSFIIHFSPEVLGFGFQIEPHYIDGPWTGNVNIDVQYGLSYSISGITSALEDGSAPFFGFVNNRPGVGTVTITINQTGPALPPRAGSLAINMLDIIVPEPSALFLVAGGLLLLGARARRRPVQGLMK